MAPLLEVVVTRSVMCLTFPGPTTTHQDPSSSRCRDIGGAGPSRRAGSGHDDLGDADDADRDGAQPFGSGQRTEAAVDLGGDGEQLRAEGQGERGPAGDLP
jgi:hypothetical protein